MAGKFKEWAKNLSADVKRDIAAEANYARDDIRQKVIEQGWTGSVQTPRAVTSYSTVKEEPEKEQEEGLDIQGNPIEGEDFSGTVWDQENRNGIEAGDVQGIEAPEIEPSEIQEPDIEPE